MWVNVFAGLSAGVAESLLVVTPGEALKTRLVQSSMKGGASKSLVSTAAYIIQNEGPRSLWRGAGSVLCKQGTNSAVRFSVYGLLEERLRTRYPQTENNILSSLLLGAMSGVVTV